jgi:hypothetical protein
MKFETSPSRELNLSAARETRPLCQDSRGGTDDAAQIAQDGSVRAWKMRVDQPMIGRPLLLRGEIETFSIAAVIIDRITSQS